jgi:hypothetical protein
VITNLGMAEGRQRCLGPMSPPDRVIRSRVTAKSRSRDLGVPVEGFLNAAVNGAEVAVLY